MKVTILTASYNRAHTLPKLYESLVSQTNNNFEWLVVDDGSKDGTENLIKNYIDEKKINIRYIKQENGGKHTAVNTGVETILNEITFIVDSDDYLSDHAIKTICEICEKYRSNEKIAGISFLRADPTRGAVIGKQYNENEFISNYIDYRINKKISGDKAEVFFTSVLKKFPFPKFNGERFLSEDVVWIEMAKQYDMVYVNEAIYYCDYLEDGLSVNDKKVKFNSPLGSMLRGKQMMYKRINFKTRLKGAIIYNCYKKEVKGKIPAQLKLKNKSDKLLVLVTKILGKIYNENWKKGIK